MPDCCLPTSQGASTRVGLPQYVNSNVERKNLSPNSYQRLASSHYSPTGKVIAPLPAQVTYFHHPYLEQRDVVTVVDLCRR